MVFYLSFQEIEHVRRGHSQEMEVLWKKIFTKKSLVSDCNTRASRKDKRRSKNKINSINIFMYVMSGKKAVNKGVDVN